MTGSGRAVGPVNNHTQPVVQQVKDKHVSSPNQGMFVNVTVEKSQLPLLVDSGACVTILSVSDWQQLLFQLSEIERDQLSNVAESVVAVHGDKLTVCGKQTLHFTLGSVTAMIPTLVVKGVTSSLLGTDALSALGFTIDFSSQHLYVAGQKLPLQIRNIQNSVCARVTIRQNTLLPPWSENIVET